MRPLQRLLRWPFALRSTLDAVNLENYTLRDALREANNEVRRHRKLLVQIQNDERTFNLIKKLNQQAV